jgi:phosphoenolpyruvate-protein phosphotransferase (PTS system enzyme I)
MSGIGASPGIAIGKACILEKKEAVLSGLRLNNDEDKAIEIEKFKKAVRLAVTELETIQGRQDLHLNNEDIDILETQIQFLTDPQIDIDVADKISTENKTAHDAVIEVIGAAVNLFRNIDDEYLRARAVDIQDIGNRILSHLNPGYSACTQVCPENTIIIAEELSPSDTILMDMKKIIGFASQMGGKTSHAALIAKTRGIPAVVGCGDALKPISYGDIVILDGSEGMVIVNPDAATMDIYQARRKLFIEKQALLKSIKNLPATTTDGIRTKLYVNISGAQDLEAMFDHGGEGVGLCRTEMLFMERNSFPSEEDQFNFYKQIAIKSKNLPVTIRTIDIGGDKQLPYFKIPHESNPFLGYRAIRICLDRKDIFLTQLKAILRASAFGKFKIMFPMICNVREIRMAKAILKEAREDLLKGNIQFDPNIETGIMIEIPAAAASADILAREVDFFSIGTNDLCQYSLAVDRMNEKVNELYDHFNPGVLRLIKNVIEQAHKHHIHVGMCGEMASDPVATLLLLGMELDEFSMSASSVPAIKSIIIKSSAIKARLICERAMQLDDSGSIRTYLEKAAI